MVDIEKIGLPTDIINDKSPSDLPPIQPKEKTPERIELEKHLETITKDQEERLKLSIGRIETQLKKEHITFKDFCLEDDEGNSLGFKPAKLAAYIRDHYNFKTDINTEIIYFFDGKSWIKDAEPYLQIIVASILGDENKTIHYKNVHHCLIGLTLDQLNFSNKIACENGLLDVETLEFKEFNIKEMPLFSIPTTYNSEAKCPNFEAFISQAVTKDDIPTIQEWSGYCLLPNYSFHKIMWIVGSGRNGKGVWQRTIEGILGVENTSNINLEEFDGSHRFAMERLYKKLVNFCSEPRTTKELQTNLLKYATGQDTIEAELKLKQKRLKFKNCAKVTVIANKFPRVNDQTTAFKERRLFLKFPNEFTGKDIVLNLEKIWLDNPEEKSGILNWMLQGLQRLLQQGYFSTSKTQEETELEFLRASDSVTAFINETATYERHLISTRPQVKTAYEAYCDYYGLEMENDKKITARLKDTPKIKDVRTRIQGQQERVWQGVNFKILTDENEIKDSDSQLKLDSVTNVTDVTGLSSSSNLLENSKIIKEYKTPVTSVTPVTNESEIDGYHQLTCVFCGKGIMDDNWISDNFTWNKPACNKCYEEKKSQLANQEDKEFG